MRFLAAIIMLFVLAGCDDGPAKLPEGFEHVSRDGRSHFVYVRPDWLDDKLAQREAGRIICRKLFDEADYCEVYFFSRKSAIPTKFPIMNRLAPVGYFEIKNDKERFRVLSDKNVANN